MKFETTINQQSLALQLDTGAGTAYMSTNGTAAPASENATAVPYEFTRIDDTRFLLRKGNATFVLANASLNEDGSSIDFTINGSWQRASVKDEQALLLDSMGFKVGAKTSQGVLKAPMPGRVLQILVEEGQNVEMGEPVAILEAMKMENELKAPVAGRLASIKVEAGTSVEKNHVLLEIEPLG